MSQANLDWRVGELERRLSRVEIELGLASGSAPVEPEVVEGSEPLQEPAGVQPPSLTDHLLRQRADVQPAAEIAEPTADEALPVSAPPLPPPPPPPIQVMPYAPLVPKTPAPQTGLEQAIGLKWAGWIGAVILVIGAGLGIKFAFDQGWFGAIPDTAKLVLMSLGGFALIGAGEWVYRRVNTISAAGLFGAGVAVFFLVSYAGFGFYALYARNTAFVLMALSTLVGAVVAKRGNLVSIAVLSLLGGNLAPIILHNATPDLHAFFAYLLMLQTVALVLAAWGGESKWWTLRGLSLASNVFWMLGLILNSPHPDVRTAEVFFLVLSAVLFQAELIFSARRGRYAAMGELANPGLLFSTLVIAVLTAGLLIALRDTSDRTRGAAVLLVASACAALGFLLPHRDNPAMHALRIGYRVQAAALLVVAVPVMLSGMGIEIGWVVLAAAFAVMAWALDLHIARVAAVGTWMLAAGHLFWRFGMHMNDGLPAVWFGGIQSHLAMAALIACAGHGISMLVERTRGGRIFPDNLRWLPTVGATLVWVGASLWMLTPLGATYSLVIYAWLLVAADMLTDRLGAAVQAVALLALATVKWVLVDLLSDRLSTTWSPVQRAAVLNPAMGAGVLIAVSLVALFWLRREALLSVLRRWGLAGIDQREATLFMAALVIGLMSIGISFEIDRSIEQSALTGGAKPLPLGQIKQLALTMLWSVAACGHLLLARYVEPEPQRRREWLGRVGWLPIALTIKFLTIDTLAYRLGSSGVSAAAVFFNLQTLAAVVVLGALMAVCFLAIECGMATFRRTAGFMIVLVLLWTGLLEIDRFFEKLAAVGSMTAGHAQFAKQVAMSIFGAVFAILSVIAGFYFRAAPVRYLGLGLFALTLVKVVLVDLANAGQGYRVLSFLGLGLLLLGTSVVYGKLSPRLLGSETAE